MLHTGIKAPEFKLLNQDGKEVSLSDYAGKKVILYFYSKDNTAGCTRQACAYNELLSDFQQKDAVILGVSKDSVSSHMRFAEKYDLKFQLLSDPEQNVIRAYDVLKEKTMYGKKVKGVVRTSYTIDENGMITDVLTKVKPDTNALDVLKSL